MPSPTRVTPFGVVGRTARLLTHRRSNGVQVPIPVIRLIRAGDRARGAGDWAAAEHAYSAALALRRDLPHIWVQAGHAAKEDGRLDDAAAAYRAAAEQAPADPEPHVHLGHVAKLTGALGQSAGHYLEALRRAPDSLAAASELMRTVDHRTAHGRQIVAEAKQLVGLADDAVANEGAADAQAGTFFDVTDLLGYFSHARLPTGIQRVQIELVAAALTDAHDRRVEACCFLEAHQGWCALPSPVFLDLVARALASDDRTDPAWRRAVIAALLSVTGAPTLRFGPGATLVNLGATWSDRNYFLHLRNAREAGGGPRYVPLIHDVIPVRRPQWFPAALVRDFRAWLVTMLAHADAFLANSEATAADLRRAADELGVPVGARAVTATPLDADFGGEAAAAEALAPHGLIAVDFVLMVSTIEPRKNHLGAFAAWRLLLDRLPAAQVPTLVCVGGRGWMNDAVHAALAEDPVLRRKVRFLHGIPDATLAALYEQCRFTLYPSLYEGWGLPITESLCHGKVPAVSNTTAMPEAGGQFAVYFDPADPADIAAALTPLLTDGAALREREARIRRDFRPRRWSAIAAQVLAATADTAAAPSIDLPSGRLSFRADIDDPLRSGEALRTGDGWAPPGPDGTGILGAAALRLPPASAIRLRVAARSGPARNVRIIADGIAISETLVGGTSRWIAVPVDPDRPPTLLTVEDSSFRSANTAFAPSDTALLVAEIAITPPV